MKLKLHDGSVKLLLDVRFLLDIKKNLILVGMLDVGGYSIKVNNFT